MHHLTTATSIVHTNTTSIGKVKVLLVAFIKATAAATTNDTSSSSVTVTAVASGDSSGR